ncbi:hypothetical protein FO519_005701 [Halicephalobus sp. NKZ332]|nr:hypothetical protein FO519_005701 [Halicephalobus sp. NKZ332]
MRSFILLASFALFALTFSLPTIGTQQSAAVMGKLLCNGKPYPTTIVKLWDVDTLDLNDLMAEGRSDENGTFALSGSETELTTIDPRLSIYHNCNDEAVECFRRVDIGIPSDFVTEGAFPAKTFDIGILNLSGELPGEARECINS